MKRHQRELLEWVLQSLRDTPEEWTSDEFAVTHIAKKIRVWIANGRWGLDVRVGSGTTRGPVFLGGVVLLAVTPWRWKLYRAATRVHEERVARKLRGYSAMKSLLLASTLLLSIQAQAQTCIDTELVLLADMSGSMNSEEKKIVRDGHVAAFRDGAVLAALDSGECGAFLVSYVEWASSQNVVIDWTLIDSDEAAEDFAAALSAASYSSVGGSTYIAHAMRFAAEMILSNNVEATNRVVDILADGRDDTPGLTAAEVRERYSGDKIPVWERITWNGLPVINSIDDGMSSASLVKYFREKIIGGPWSTVIPAYGFEDVPRAIVEKLSKELG